ncbi:uncharacterized protein METZ01_LOCUS349436, partial [marine metagenome]
MKYYSAIISSFILSFLSTIVLLHLGNVTREIEKSNITLKEKINFMQDQININEIEYSLFISYNYLKKLQTIYFDEENISSPNNRISFYDLENQKF